MFPIKYGLFKLDIIDYYAILGVPLNADAKQIRQQYLKIVQNLHPDVCRANGETQKQQASQILSKWVNPAYEQLSKDKLRVEYQVMLSQVGQSLAGQSGKITLASEVAKELSKAGKDLQPIYRKLLKSLAAEQYQDLEQVPYKIAQISELNMVYLLLKGQVETTRTATAQAGSKKEEKAESPMALHLRRAQEYLNKNQLAQAILELRDALKLDPNHSSCHGLMGLAYLKQNQISMAKVHINKAYQSNPKDLIAIKSKQELERLTAVVDPKTQGRSAKDKSVEPPGGGIFGGLFGGKKK